MQKEVITAMTSSKNEHFETPQAFFDRLNKKFNFVIDLAATKDNAKCNYFVDDIFDPALFDFLILPPKSSAFMNPPYGKNIGKFIKRAINLADYFKLQLVMLLPARTDTKWFNLIWDRDYNQPLPHFNVNFLKGRLAFELNGQPIINEKTGKKQGALFPSMVVVYNAFAKGNF